MMNDPVLEIGCENLSGLGIAHYKADRFTGLVIAGCKRFCERNDICAQISLEFLRVHGAAFASAAVDISLENV